MLLQAFPFFLVFFFVAAIHSASDCDYQSGHTRSCIRKIENSWAIPSSLLFNPHSRTNIPLLSCSLALQSCLQLCFELQPFQDSMVYTIRGPLHICSLYTTLAKYSRNKFSVHECSDCEHCEMFSVPFRSDFKSAHISVCAV